MNGGYGAWEPYGACTKSCGGGIQTRTRDCDSPKPENGGEDCGALGPANESRSCNDETCAGKLVIEISWDESIVTNRMQI